MRGLGVITFGYQCFISQNYTSLWQSYHACAALLAERQFSFVLFFAYSSADVFYLQCTYVPCITCAYIYVSKGNLIKSELEL